MLTITSHTDQHHPHIYNSLRKVVVHGKNSRDITVCDIMTTRENVIAVSPQHTVHECLSIMETHGFRHLPVLEYDLAHAQAAAALDGLTPEDVPPPKVLAMISQRQLVSQFLKYHHAQVDYMQEYISFPIW
jgi:CBS domain-containing protein